MGIFRNENGKLGTTIGQFSRNGLGGGSGGIDHSGRPGRPIIIRRRGDTDASGEERNGRQGSHSVKKNQKGGKFRRWKAETKKDNVRDRKCREEGRVAIAPAHRYRGITPMTFDGRRRNNEIERIDDTQRTKRGPCRGMQFVDILKNRIEYSAQVQNAEPGTTNQTYEDEPSILTFRRYLSMAIWISICRVIAKEKPR